MRVVLPAYLRVLASLPGEIVFPLDGPATVNSVIDHLEREYPILRGTIREQVTKKRRPFVRFFACQQDLSHDSPDAPLPDAVAAGKEPLLIVGAISGGRDAHRDSMNS